MSRRCRASLGLGASRSGGGGNLGDSGCDCARLAGVAAPELPCTEPLIYGANVLRDPGFELHTDLVPRGPATDDFPDGLWIPGDSFSAGGLNPGSLYWDTTPITEDIYWNQNGWAVWSNNVGAFGTDPSPIISNANPRTGTYHWRVSYIENQNWSGVETYPIPLGGYYCSTDPSVGAGLRQGYSARCGPGDLIVASLYAMRNAFSGDPVVVEMAIGFFDTQATAVGSFITELSTLTTSYTKREFSAFAPPNAYACVVEYVLFPNDVVAGPLHIDVDDCAVGVSQSGTNVLLCAQNTLITIDNSTTETDFL